MLGFVHEGGEVVEPIESHSRSSRIEFHPASLEAAKGLESQFAGIGPIDSFEIVKEGTPVTARHNGSEVSDLVDQAELVRDSQEVFDGLLNGLVFIGDDEPEGVAVKASFEEVIDKSLPGVQGLSIAEKETQDMAIAKGIHA